MKNITRHIFLLFMVVMIALLAACGSPSSDGDDSGNTGNTYTTNLNLTVSLGGFDNDDAQISLSELGDWDVTISSGSNVVDYSMSDSSYLYQYEFEHNGSISLEFESENYPDLGTFTEVIQTTEIDYSDTVVLETDDYMYCSLLNVNIRDPYLDDPDIEGATYTFSGDCLLLTSTLDSEYLLHNGEPIITASAESYTTYNGSFILDTETQMDYVYVYLFKPEYSQTIVSGNVTFYYSNTPVEDVKVSYTRASDTIYTYTDELGSYSITVPHKGSFSLSFQKDDFSDSNQSFETTDSNYSYNQEMNVHFDYWSSISGYIYENDGSTPIEGATISMGDFSATTDSFGYYNGVYAEKGEAYTMTVAADGFISKTKSINTYVNSLQENFSLDNVPSENVTVSGSVRDSSTSSYILDGDLYITADVTSATINSGNYSATISNTDGTFIIQAGGASGYNLYSWSIDTTQASVTHNIFLTPTLGSPVTTTFSGYIKNQDGNVPSNLDECSLSFNGALATINFTTGAYSCTTSANMGAVIVQGGGTGYYILRRTIETSASSYTYDVIFTEM